MNESGPSRMPGLEKRLGDRGLNLLRRVICRDIEPLAWLLCADCLSPLEPERGDYTQAERRTRRWSSEHGALRRLQQQ